MTVVQYINCVSLSFKSVGSIDIVDTIQNVHLDVHLHPIQERCDNFEKAFKTIGQKARIVLKQRLPNLSPELETKFLQINATKLTVIRACTVVKSWPGTTTIPSSTLTEVHTRNKRQIIPLIFSFSVGTLMGIFGNHLFNQDHAVQDELDETIITLQHHDHRLADLEHHMEILDNILRDNEMDQFLTSIDRVCSAANDFVHHIHDMSQGISQLFDQKLTTSLVNPELLQSTLKELQALAHSKNADLPFATVDQLLQLPVVFSPTSTGLKIIVQVPFIRQTLQLYHLETSQFIHTPPSGSPTVLQVKAPKPLLAINEKSGSFQEMNSEDLAECAHIGTKYFCKLQILYRQQSSSCLGGLYEGQLSAITKYCEVSVSPNQWHLQPSENQVSIYMAQRSTLMTTCQNGSSTISHIQGQHTLHVPFGCYLRSEQFEYYPIETKFWPTIIHVNNTWAFNEVFPSVFTFSTFEEELANLPVGSDIRHLLSTRQHVYYQQRLHLAFTVGSMILVIIVLIVICVCCVNRHRRSS